jgi:hypothetical protein
MRAITASYRKHEKGMSLLRELLEVPVSLAESYLSGGDAVVSVHDRMPICLSTVADPVVLTGSVSLTVPFNYSKQHKFCR